MGGVAIAPSGEAALMIGLESEEYARGRSVISNIKLMKEYRETADPEYPGMSASTYIDTFASIGVKNLLFWRRKSKMGPDGWGCEHRKGGH